MIASVKGGGKSGQCGAVVHATSRALSSLDEEIKSILKKAGFLTRDSRVKEQETWATGAANDSSSLNVNRWRYESESLPCREAFFVSGGDEKPFNEEQLG